MPKQEYGTMDARYAHLRGYFRGTLMKIQDSSDKQKVSHIVNTAMTHLDKIDAERETELDEKK